MQAWEQALDLRTELAQWWVSQHGRNFGEMWTAAKVEPSSVYPRNLADVEAMKLSIAPPYYITAEMCELLTHAQQTFPPSPLRAVDLPTPMGFVLMAKPMWVVDIHSFDLPWQAFCWGLAGRADDPSVATGVHLSIYTHRDNDPAREEMGGAPEWPTLSMMHESAWSFDDYSARDTWAPGMVHNQGMEISEEALLSGVEMLRTIHTFFAFCQQKIGVPQDTMASRPVRKRAQRFDPNRPIPNVRVVTLRRHKQATNDDDEFGSREWTHRWMVNGHWRSQWYPSENRHKPKWIAPYVKGPDDKPFQAKDTTYIWRR